MLALEVVRSALTSMQQAREVMDDFNEDMYERLEPFINKLSVKLVEKVKPT